MIILLLFTQLLFANNLTTYNGQIAGSLRLVHTVPNDNAESISHRLQIAPTLLIKSNPNINFDAIEPNQIIIAPTQVILPTRKRYGIVVNIAEKRLFDFSTPGKVYIYSVGVGREKWKTPVGKFTITHKRHLPTWNIPLSVHKEELAKGNKLPKSIPPGPDNPLGKYSMRLSHSSYLIHGTNEPEGIGTPSTSGCISMFPDDIEHLFGRIPIGTPVQIVNVPIKIVKQNGTLWVESHLTSKNDSNYFTKEEIDDMMGQLAKANNLSDNQLTKIRAVIEENSGIPFPIK